MPKPILSLLFLLISVLPAWSDTYLAAGCASTDREWRATDYATLNKLIESKAVELPTFKTPEGAKVIRRVCAAENLAFGQNLTLPLPARFEDFLGIQSSLGSITKPFVAAVISGADYSEEISLLVSQTLRVAALGIDLMNEFVPTLKKDETYETRMQGVYRMKSGLTTVFLGAYTSVADDAIYADTQRTAILKVISQVAPKFATAMSPETKTEMHLKFTKLKERMMSPNDLNSIDSITKALAPTKP